MKKILTFILVSFSLILLSSCVVSSNTSIQFSTIPDPYYFAGSNESEVKNDLSIDVYENNTKINTLNLTNSDITIVNDLDFTTTGDKTFIIKYRDLTLSFQYSVITEASLQQTVDTDWYTENTNATEYTLTTPGQLRGLANLVNSGATDFDGITIKLGADIDLGGVSWIPIGEGNRSDGALNGRCFKGTFDGQNHIISNLTNKGYKAPSLKKVYEASNGTKVSGYFYGLFGIINSKVLIQNVQISNVQIMDSGFYINDSNETIYTGIDSGAAIVGYVTGSLTIINCKVNSGNIAGFDAIAGIVGRNYAGNLTTQIVLNCSNSANVTSARSSSCKMGGIIACTSDATNILVGHCKNNGVLSFIDNMSYNADIIGMIGATPRVSGKYGYYYCQGISSELFSTNVSSYKVYFENELSLNQFNEYLMSLLDPTTYNYYLSINN